MVKLDSVPKVKLIDGEELAGDIKECCHFTPLRRESSAGCESRCSSFSHDGKYFAWSLGFGFVKIVWFTTVRSTELRDTSTASRGSVDWYRRIDCAKPVLAMEFGHNCMDGASDGLFYLLATGLENGRIKVWNAVSGDMVYNLSDHYSDVNGLAFTHVGGPLLVSCSSDKTLKVWDLLDDGNMTLTVKSHFFPVLDCKVCPSDPTLICSVGKGRSVIVWTLPNKRSYSRYQNLHGHLNDVVSCSWSPDGALLTTASHDATVIVWDPRISQKLVIMGHKNPLPDPIYAGGSNGAWLRCVDFAPDGSRIATVCEDDRVRIWSVLPSTSPVQTQTIAYSGLGCRFSPGGSLLALGSVDGSTSVFEVKISVMPLRHLSRMTVRKMLTSLKVQKLGLPVAIEGYLLYRTL